MEEISFSVSSLFEFNKVELYFIFGISIVLSPTLFDLFNSFEFLESDTFKSDDNSLSKLSSLFNKPLFFVIINLLLLSTKFEFYIFFILYKLSPLISSFDFWIPSLFIEFFILLLLLLFI